MKTKPGLKIAFFVAIAATVVLTSRAQQQIPASAADLPDFIYTVRAYGAGTHDDFEFSSMKELGLQYLEHHWSFFWPAVEPRNNEWRWDWTDSVMAKIVQYGLKFIPFLQIPKLVGLHWDTTITRTDPRFRAEYGEFAYEAVKRYHTHPAWSGIVAVWGGSSDIWGVSPLQEPEVHVPLLNAAYEGIKRADPNTIVIGFNMGTVFGATDSSWENWHQRAFALLPKFDWFGVQSHNVPVTYLRTPETYAGAVGLINVRRFLDAHGYTDKPMFLNEGGFVLGEDIEGFSEGAHAEQVVETYIVARTLNVNLKGWVYFSHFDKTNVLNGGPFGLMSSLDQADPPQPRPAWYALQALIKTVRFFDYQFDTKLSGEYNKPSPPFVYRFIHRSGSSSKLWVIFSPRLPEQAPIGQVATIEIAPATSATLIDMLGRQMGVITADSSGNVTITSTSSPIYLKVDPPVPAAPTLASPADGATGVSTNPVLSWNAVSGAASYTLQVSTSSSFGTFVVNQSGITSTSFAVSGLQNNIQYFWRVSATNAAGAGPFSATRTFTTIVAAPSAPTLVSPADGATDVSTSPKLTWNPVSEATSYSLQLSTSSAFTSFVVNQASITATSFGVTGLSNKTQYFWRVSATNTGGTGPFSAARTFTTGVPSSVELVGDVLPEESSLDQNYPNPFNPSTSIRFSLPRETHVRIRILSAEGKEVVKLVNETRSAGIYAVRWDGKDAKGSSVASGVYFYRLESEFYTRTRKMVVVK